MSAAAEPARVPEPAASPQALSIVVASEPRRSLAPVRRVHFFDDAQCDEILEAAKSLNLSAGRMYVPRENTRVCQQAPFEAHGRLSWVKTALDRLVASVNEGYRFELTAGLSRFLYVRYTAGGHIDWHSDYDAHAPNPRKISVSIQLSEPSGYAGGALEFHPLGEIPMSGSRGTAIVFPSFLSHRAAAVASGERHVLVAWYAGPHLR